MLRATRLMSVCYTEHHGDVRITAELNINNAMRLRLPPPTASPGHRNTRGKNVEESLTQDDTDYYSTHELTSYDRLIVRVRTAWNPTNTAVLAKKWAVVLRLVTSSVMDHFKEIPQLESLLNFQKDAHICHIPSKCYHFTLQNGKQCTSASGVLQITGSNAVICTCIE